MDSTRKQPSYYPLDPPHANSSPPTATPTALPLQMPTPPLSRSQSPPPSPPPSALLARTPGVLPLKLHFQSALWNACGPYPPTDPRPSLIHAGDPQPQQPQHPTTRPPQAEKKQSPKRRARRCKYHPGRPVFTYARTAPAGKSGVTMATTPCLRRGCVDCEMWCRHLFSLDQDRDEDEEEKEGAKKKADDDDKQEDVEKEKEKERRQQHALSSREQEEKKKREKNKKKTKDTTRAKRTGTGPAALRNDQRKRVVVIKFHATKTKRAFRRLVRGWEGEGQGGVVEVQPGEKRGRGVVVIRFRGRRTRREFKKMVRAWSEES